MKAIFLLTALILIGAPFLTTAVHTGKCWTVPYTNGICPIQQPNNETQQQDINTTHTHVMTQQQMTCTPPTNGSCAVYNGTATTTIDSNGTKTTVLNTQTICDDGSHADNNGMCHYPICPDGSNPVGKGTCVGPERGECIHAADGNGNCRDMMYCGGPATVIGGVTSCPDRAPTNTSLTPPPLRCDQPGFVSCYKFGFGAGWLDPTLNYCPMSGYANHGNTTQDAHYCLGFTAGQIQEPIDQAKLAKAPSPACPTHTPSCCVGKNGEIIGNATDRRCA